MSLLFYIWLYALGVAIVHDEWLQRYRHSDNLKVRRLYRWLPVILYRARKEKQDAQSQ